jgi:hypothetical protein
MHHMACVHASHRCHVQLCGRQAQPTVGDCCLPTGADKSAYLTMMMARTTMIGGAAGALSKAR